MFRKMIHASVNWYARLRGREPWWVQRTTARFSRRVDEIFGGFAESLVTAPARFRLADIISTERAAQVSVTDRYWGSHTVRGKTFLSRQASLDYITELTDGRPFKRQLLGLHGPHEGKTILDYGCGPGNDLAGFAEFSNAARVIGVDISKKALKLARKRVSWHCKNPAQMVFIQNCDNDVRLPLDDASVDYIQSLGVIHHATNPNLIFREFHRLLKPGGEARIMLYNADSVHIQLNIGYQRCILQDSFPGKSPEATFTMLADLGAPIAHCVRPPDVQPWLEEVPFQVDFLGGYFMPGEQECWQQLGAQALADDRVRDRQRAFLESLSAGEKGFAHLAGKPAGLGAVYRLQKQ